MLDLYKLFYKPTDLIGYEKRENYVPSLALKRAIEYADDNNGARFTEGEKSIAKDSQCAYNYAIKIVKGKFPIGEKAIAKDPYYALMYAGRIIKGKFPEGEVAIASDGEYSYKYATQVLRNRFQLGDPHIKRSAYKANYEDVFDVRL